MPPAKRNQVIPPLEWLRAYEAAARLNGFTQAAEELSITQAAVSQRIKNLENWLERTLFVREARGVSLTMDGESYYPVVHDAFGALQLGTDDLFGKSPTEIRIAALTSHIGNLISPYMAALAREKPGLAISIDSVGLQSEFEANQTPVQLRFGRGDWAGRDAALLHPEVLVPMCANPLAEVPLLAAPLIEIRGRRPSWDEWSARSGISIPPSARLSFDSMAPALAAAENAGGVVLASIPQAACALATGRLVRLELPTLETKDGYWLTWPTAYARSKKHMALLEFICRTLSVA